MTTMFKSEKTQEQEQQQLLDIASRQAQAMVNAYALREGDPMLKNLDQSSIDVIGQQAVRVAKAVIKAAAPAEDDF